MFSRTFSGVDKQGFPKQQKHNCLLRRNSLYPLEQDSCFPEYNSGRFILNPKSFAFENQSCLAEGFFILTRNSFIINKKRCAASCINKTDFPRCRKVIFCLSQKAVKGKLVIFVSLYNTDFANIFTAGKA